MKRIHSPRMVRKVKVKLSQKFDPALYLQSEETELDGTREWKRKDRNGILDDRFATNAFKVM